MCNDNKEWRFCVVGNIVTQHQDEDGNIFYGSKPYTGGTKVYIEDDDYRLNKGVIWVIGLNRFHRYSYEAIPIDLIENVRLKRVFKPKVLKVMDYLETFDGWQWRNRTAEDRRILERFVKEWENTMLAMAIDKLDIAMVNKYLEHGANPNHINEEGPIFEEFDSNVIVDITYGLMQNFDVRFKIWLLLIAYGGIVKNKECPVKVKNGYSVEMFKDYENFDYNIKYGKGDWKMNIVRKDTLEVVAVV